jgi:Ca2+-binding RTX toxin-like protein
VTVLGSDETDWIFCNSQNNYITGGKGPNYLSGGYGDDVYIIKQGDGLNVIYQGFTNDDSVDTILFDAKYDDIEVSTHENLYILLKAYETDSNKSLSVALSCQSGPQEYYYRSDYNDVNCNGFNKLHYFKTTDGVIFRVPLDILENRNQVSKIPVLLDYSKRSCTPLFSTLDPKCLSPDITENSTQVVRFIGSNYSDDIIGNSLKNYMDPRVGGSHMEGRDGSDTYIIRANYSSDNTINNYASDHKLDVLLFMVPYDNIVEYKSGNNLILDSKSGRVSVTLFQYCLNDTYQHLLIVSEDGIMFVLPQNKSYAPTPIIINKSRAKTGQFINLTYSSNYSEVRSVYGAQSFENHIVGNKERNTLVGGIKSDLLEGLDGDDVLKGGPGDDKLDGGPGDDLLAGGAGNDTLYGGDGDDMIAPGLGENVIDGGNGTDTVVYSDSISGIEALLFKNVTIIKGKIDTMYDVESVIGTVFDDNLEGDGRDNVLVGKEGNDRFTPGLDGYDILVGGNGSDTYDLATDASNSTVIIDNFATDGKFDNVSLCYKNLSQIGLQRSGDDLVIRGRNFEHPVFWAMNTCGPPIVILKDWFHCTTPELYRHMNIKLREDLLRESDIMKYKQWNDGNCQKVPN